MASEQVPVSALRFSVGEFELGDNGESAKSAPFRMVARSGQPIEHPYWGNVVHDLSGMRLAKGRIPIDYAHDDKEVIGYANHFDTANGDLVASGALIPFKESDRATEVIFKAKAGVPYEASINFGGDGIRLERVREGQSVSVNNYTFAGPGIVVREWPLRGIAVCPYGADGNTSTQFSQDATVTVEVMEADMPQEEINKLEEQNQQAAEAQAVEANTPTDSDIVAEAEPIEAEAVEAAATAMSQRRTEGERFLEAFGDRGGVWFAQGLSFEDAQGKFVAELLTENQQLRQRLSGKQSDGEESPVSFSQHVPPQPKRNAIRIAKR